MSSERWSSGGDCPGGDRLASDPPGQGSTATPVPIAELLAALEALSRARPDRVLRLRGNLPSAARPSAAAAADGGREPLPPSAEPCGSDPHEAEREPFELLIFRGFSSLTTHPTAFDPDRSALPEGARISSAELLAAPLDPDGGVPLAGPAPAEAFLVPELWA